MICISAGLRTWIVERRYNEFATLHRHLCRLFPHFADLRFPGKKYIGSMSPEFVDERQRQLQVCVRVCVVCVLCACV